MQGNKGLKKKAGNSIAWTGLSVLAQTVFRLGLVALQARLLAPADFGIIATALLFANILPNILFDGIGYAVVRRLNLSNGFVSAAYVLSITLGLLGFALLALSAETLGGLLDAPETASAIAVLSILLLIRGVSVPAEALLARAFQFRYTGLLELFAYTVIYGVGGVLLILAGLSYWGILIAMVAERLFKTAAVLLRARGTRLAWPSREDWRELRRSALKLSANHMVLVMAGDVDQLIVVRTLGLESLGIYSRAFYLMKQPGALFGRVTKSVTLASFSAASHDLARVRRGFLTGVEFSALVGLPMTAVMMTLAEPIVLTLFGNQWTAMIAPFSVLAAICYVRFAAILPGTVQLAIGRVSINTWLNLLYLVMMTICVFAGSHFGLIGVAAGTATATAIWFAATNLMLARTIDLPLSELVRAHIPGIRLALPLGAVALAVNWTAGDFLYAPVTLVLAIASLAMCLMAGMRLAPSLLLGETAYATVRSASDHRRLGSLIRTVIGRKNLSRP